MQAVQPIQSLHPMTIFDSRGVLEAALPARRIWPAQHCAHLVGSTADADDLAQETLLEARRSLDTLRDQEFKASTTESSCLAAISTGTCVQ